MARVCSSTRFEPGECWCPVHRSNDPDEDRKRQVVGTAPWEFKGGEALHVFVRSKEGREVSLCNLRQAAPEEAARSRRLGHPDPKLRCLQCRRTLTSRVPNARMRRYLAEKPPGRVRAAGAGKRAS